MGWIRWIGFSTLAVGWLAVSPAAATPRYERVLLPDLGNGAHARDFLRRGSVRVAVGDVNGDAVPGVKYPALWFSAGGKWRLHRLSDLGKGGTVNAAVWNDTDKAPHCCGTVEDSEGNQIAAVWVLRPTRRGWTDTLVPLTALGEGSSDAVAFLLNESIDYPSYYVLGALHGPLPDQHQAVIWTLTPAALDAGFTISDDFLNEALSGNSEPVGGAALPGGNLRIVGCLEFPAGSGLEFAAEWVGNPGGGFTAQLLPEPGPGLAEYHALAVDPLLRYAVGARFFPGGGFEPAGWAGAGAQAGRHRGAPSAFDAGSFTPLPIPSTGTGAAHLFAVNSSGRALGVADGEDYDNWTYLTRVNVPDSPRLPLGAYVEDELQDGDFDDLGERGSVAGSVSFAGKRRACLLLPTADEAPDRAIIEEIPIPSGIATGTLERALVWDDTDIVHINQQTPADWSELELEFDLSRFDIDGFPDSFRGPAAAARRQGPAILVTVRVDGPKNAELLEHLLLWNFQQKRWDRVHSARIRGGKFQRLRHPLPAALAPYVGYSEWGGELIDTNHIRAALAFTPSNGTGDAFYDVLVSSVVTNARELALDDYAYAARKGRR